jgi:hypothetical protein
LELLYQASQITVIKRNCGTQVTILPRLLETEFLLGFFSSNPYAKYPNFEGSNQKDQNTLQMSIPRQYYCLCQIKVKPDLHGNLTLWGGVMRGQLILFPTSMDGKLDGTMAILVIAGQYVVGRNPNELATWTRGPPSSVSKIVPGIFCELRVYAKFKFLCRTHTKFDNSRTIPTGRNVCDPEKKKR